VLFRSGRYGLYATHAGEPGDLDAQLGDLGRRWETTRIAFKPYPACHFSHAAVDAAVQAAEGASVADIDEIRVRIPPPGVPIVLEPAAAKRAPVTPYDAKFSLAWCAAARLVDGRLDAASFAGDHIADAQILALAGRVRHEPWGDTPAPSPFAGSATVRTRDGAVGEAALDAPRGSPENPLTDAALLEKYAASSSLVLDAEARETLAAALLALPDVADVRDALAPLGAAARL
jgi:2-methylcitrate dehydratase PrpD